MRKLLDLTPTWLSLFCIMKPPPSSHTISMPFEAHQLPGSPIVYLVLDERTYKELFPTFLGPAFDVLHLSLTPAWSCGRDRRG